MSDRLLKMPAVRAQTSLSPSTIYDRIKRGKFPKAVDLGGGSVAWLESEVQAWIQDRVAESRPLASAASR